MNNWIGVLRMGALLSLGWVAAAGFAWAQYGVVPAAIVLGVWVLLLVRFHKAVEALARGVAAGRQEPASEP